MLKADGFRSVGFLLCHLGRSERVSSYDHWYNAYDVNVAAGILVHQYGSHVFHTNADPILEYLSQSTAW